MVSSRRTRVTLQRCFLVRRCAAFCSATRPDCAPSRIYPGDPIPSRLPRARIYSASAVIPPPHPGFSRTPCARRIPPLARPVEFLSFSLSFTLSFSPCFSETPPRVGATRTNPLRLGTTRRRRSALAPLICVLAARYPASNKRNGGNNPRAYLPLLRFVVHVILGT